MKRALNFIETMIEHIIFASRWTLVPMYLGLSVASLFYSYKFLIELIHLASAITVSTEAKFMMGVLSLIDIIMVANLIIMVLIGGYSTFVSHLNIQNHEDKPEWLEKMDAGTLKVKLTGSLVGVSGIHLLRTFMSMDTMKPEHVHLQIIIHIVFVVSTILLAYSEAVLRKKH